MTERKRMAVILHGRLSYPALTQITALAMDEAKELRDKYRATFKMPFDDTYDQIDPDMPRRLSIERRSPHYSSVNSLIGVRIDGVEQGDVVEYDMDGRWARIAERDGAGKLQIVPGKPEYRTRRVEGVTVQPYFKVEPSRQVRRALRRA